MNERDYTSKWDNNQNVFELQQFLRYIAQYYDEIPTVNPDGIYGTETQNSVKAFQKRFGLAETGMTDASTWDMIRAVYSKLQRQNRTPQPVYIFPVEIPHMEEGDSIEEIYALQLLLRRLGKIYGNITIPDITGEFDRKTTQSVNDLKRLSGMEEDGRVNRETWNILADTYSGFTFND